MPEREWEKDDIIVRAKHLGGMGINPKSTWFRLVCQVFIALSKPT